MGKDIDLLITFAVFTKIRSLFGEIFSVVEHELIIIELVEKTSNIILTLKKFI